LHRHSSRFSTSAFSPLNGGFREARITAVDRLRTLHGTIRMTGNYLKSTAG